MKILYYVGIFVMCSVFLIPSTKALAAVTQWATGVVASAGCANPANATGPKNGTVAKLNPGGWLILEFASVIDQDWCDWDFRIFRTIFGKIKVEVSNNPNGPWTPCNHKRAPVSNDELVEIPDWCLSDKKYVKITNTSNDLVEIDAVGDLADGGSVSPCVPGPAVVTSTVSNMGSFARYTYGVTPTTSEVNVFSIEVGDPDSNNYSNFQQPDGWRHKIVQRDGTLCLTFYLFDGYSLPSGQTSQFGFDNLSSEYNCFDWGLKCDECCDFDLDNSDAHPDSCGEGGKVHAPGRSRIPTLTEWGLIIFGVVLLGFITYVFLRRRKALVSLR